MLVLDVMGCITRVGNVPGVERVAQADVMVLGSAGEQPPVPGPAQRVDLPHVLQEPRRNSSGRASYSLAWPVDQRVCGSDKAQGILLSGVGPRFRVLVKGVEVGSEGWYLGPGYFGSGPQAPLVRVPGNLLKASGQGNRVQVDIQGQVLRIAGLAVSGWEMPLP